MQTTVRTTIRIREDLLKQSRYLALEQDTSLQEVVNNLLAKGLGHISDLNRRKSAMKNIDQFRQSLRGKKINVNKLLADNKRELEDRANRWIRK